MAGLNNIREAYQQVYAQLDERMDPEERALRRAEVADKKASRMKPEVAAKYAGSEARSAEREDKKSKGKHIHGMADSVELDGDLVDEGKVELKQRNKNEMQRKAGNLGREVVSTPNTKKHAAKRGAAMDRMKKLVSVIARDDEEKRFKTIGQSPLHNSYEMEEGLDMKTFKSNRAKAQKAATRADSERRSLVGHEWHNTGRKYTPDEAKSRRANMSDDDRAARHRVAVDPDDDRDENTYSADKTKNPKKQRKQAAMGEEFQIWVESLIEEGYDLSDYTLDEMYEFYIDEEKRFKTINREEVDLEEKRGLWDNIHAKRKRGERPAKPGEKGYPKTLNVEELDQIIEGIRQARKNVGASKCWTGKKLGNPPTKIKGGKEVPNCEETQYEAVYGGEKKEPEDKRMVVTNADKKAKTKAWLNYKAGHKGYRAADHLDERALDPTETAEKERIVKGMKKSAAGFKKRYGKRAKQVMFATATARAKERMDTSKSDRRYGVER